MTQFDITDLPLPEKLQLMESLWDSLCGMPVSEQGIPAWHQAVLADRMARLESGEEELIPWAEARKRIRAEVESRG